MCRVTHEDIPTNAASPFLVSGVIKTTQAFCVMGIIAAVIMFIFAGIYNFVHAIPKRFALRMFTIISAAAGEMP